MGLLCTLYQYQQEGHLCDVTVRSSEGKEFVAHAAILAATSSVLAQELSVCDRGNYTIEMPLNSIQTAEFIKFSYTGVRRASLVCHHKDIRYFCDQFDEESHEKHVIKRLNKFAENGFLCNMAWCRMPDEIQPSHSFLMAAKYDFMSQHIITGSIVYVTLSETSWKTLSGSSWEDENYFETHANNISSEYNYACDLRDKVCNSERFLLSHKATHEMERRTYIAAKLHTCDICHNNFKTKSDMTAHKRIHTGEKPYACTTCQKCFRTNSLLKQHERIHCDAKNYSCSTCGLSFRLKKYLKVHERTHNIVKTYTCSTCNKDFVRDTYLKRHELIHIDARPYLCVTCGKGFRTNSAMRQHERIQIGP